MGTTGILIRMAPTMVGFRGFEVEFFPIKHSHVKFSDLSKLVCMHLGALGIEVMFTMDHCPIDLDQKVLDYVVDSDVVDFEYHAVAPEVPQSVMSCDASVQTGGHRRRRSRRHSRAIRQRPGPPCGVSVFKYLRIRRNLALV